MNTNSPALDSASPQPDDLVAARYEIRRSLGSGGSGTVFLAWDVQLKRQVAIKRWNPLEPMLDDPAGTERLWREAMTLAAIQHPNILTIHDFGVDAKGPYVVMEFIDGETLNQAVHRAPFSLEEFTEAAQQVLEALAAAHQAGMIHRDLKPQNIMRMRLPSGAWQYKVLDFGLARFVQQPTVQSMEGNTSIYGSILYIAPEQLRHLPLDARTDIYAIGCVFYYLLSGQNAIIGDTIPALITSRLENRVKSLAEWRPDLPKALCDWVMKAMAYDPDDRFPSAVAALGALRKILPNTGRPSSIRVTSTPAGAAGIRIMTPPPAAHKTGPLTPTASFAIPTAPLPAGGGIAATAPLPAAPPAPRASRQWPLVAAVSGLALLVAFALFLHFRPARHAAEPEPPTAAATTAPQAPVVVSWRDESMPVEDKISSWPASIAEARRPLIQKYFEQLRDLQDPKWGSIGTVLECLAAIQYNSRHDPKKTKALCNFTYHDETGRTLGEIDVVIWNVQENRAEVMYEAAVSDQLHRKAVPSRNQLQRFPDSIRAGKVAKVLYPYDSSLHFEPSQFVDAKVCIMGNQCALAAGFDYEVDITRFENDYLQRRLIDWRKAHQPAKKKKGAPPSEPAP